MSDGPVCHVPPVNIPANPQSHALPGIGAPAQPNIASLVRAVNDLQRVVRILSGQNQPISPSQTINGFKTKADKPKESRWSEAGRATEKVKVYQNNDPTSDNWVEVEQINELTMQDAVTKEQWKWRRG